MSSFPSDDPRAVSVPALGRLAAYAAAAALFGLMALGPAAAAIGLTGGRSLLGWLVASAWFAAVVVVVRAFDRAVEAPSAADIPAAASRVSRADGRRTNLNVPALCGAACVAVLMLLVMARAWA